MKKKHKPTAYELIKTTEPCLILGWLCQTHNLSSLRKDLNGWSAFNLQQSLRTVLILCLPSRTVLVLGCQSQKIPVSEEFERLVYHGKEKRGSKFSSIMFVHPSVRVLGRTEASGSYFQ